MELQKDFFSMSSKLPPVNDNPPTDKPKIYSVGHYPKVICPHCLGSCTGWKTSQQTELVREIYYACQTPDCGHVFVAQLVPVRTILKSQMPNPEIRLPNYQEKSEAN